MNWKDSTCWNCKSTMYRRNTARLWEVPTRKDHTKMFHNSGADQMLWQHLCVEFPERCTNRTRGRLICACSRLRRQHDWNLKLSGSIIRATKPYSLRHQPHRFGQSNHVTSHLSEGAWSRPGHFNKRVLPPHRFYFIFTTRIPTRQD